MKDSVKDINQALAALGEPPLGPGDRVQTRFVEERTEVVPDQAEEAAEAKQIELLEPPGFKRCELVLMNGRGLLLDMQYEELVEKVRGFLADASQDLLELPAIEVLGGDREGNGGVCAAVPMSFSRRQLEMLSTMSVAWAKRVPGQLSGSKGKIAVIRGDDAKVVVEMTNKQRRQLERHG